jgi:homoserine dehydrogenase
MVAFEAAVAGGIPIIKALREGLTANQHPVDGRHHQRHHQLHPVRDARQGPGFCVVLKEAQRLGYAEADPTFDIEGVDAAHKATIMAAIAFGMPVQFDKAYTEGITKLGAADIKLTPSNWATASSCWALPSARPRALSCACTPAWCLPSA